MYIRINYFNDSNRPCMSRISGSSSYLFFLFVPLSLTERHWALIPHFERGEKHHE